MGLPSDMSQIGADIPTYILKYTRTSYSLLLYKVNALLRWAGVRGPARKSTPPTETVLVRENGTTEEFLTEPAKPLPIHARF